MGQNKGDCLFCSTVRVIIDASHCKSFDVSHESENSEPNINFTWPDLDRSLHIKANIFTVIATIHFHRVRRSLNGLMSIKMMWTIQSAICNDGLPAGLVCLSQAFIWSPYYCIYCNSMYSTLWWWTEYLTEPHIQTRNTEVHFILTTVCSLSSSCIVRFLTTSINWWPWKQSNKHTALLSGENPDSHRLFVGLLFTAWLQAISLSVSLCWKHKVVHQAGVLLSDGASGCSSCVTCKDFFTCFQSLFHDEELWPVELFSKSIWTVIK